MMRAHFLYLTQVPVAVSLGCVMSAQDCQFSLLSCRTMMIIDYDVCMCVVVVADGCIPLTLLVDGCECCHLLTFACLLLSLLLYLVNKESASDH